MTSSNSTLNTLDTLNQVLAEIRAKLDRIDANLASILAEPPVQEEPQVQEEHIVLEEPTVEVDTTVCTFTTEETVSSVRREPSLYERIYCLISYKSVYDLDLWFKHFFDTDPQLGVNRVGYVVQLTTKLVKLAHEKYPCDPTNILWDIECFDLRWQGDGEGPTICQAFDIEAGMHINLDGSYKWYDRSNKEVLDLVLSVKRSADRKTVLIDAFTYKGDRYNKTLHFTETVILS